MNYNQVQTITLYEYNATGSVATTTATTIYPSFDLLVLLFLFFGLPIIIIKLFSHNKKTKLKIINS